MSTRKLVVKVINGRGLKNKETFQTSDPYCLVEVGTEHHKTKHVNSNLNPDWEEQFVFNIPEDLNVLSLSVWDKNTIKKDVFMGYTFVTFDDCLSNVETTKTVNMMGGLSGQITLSLAPEFETSASKIERLDKEVKIIKVDDTKSKEEVADLKVELNKLSQDNALLADENKTLNERCNMPQKDESSLEELNKLKGDCETLTVQNNNHKSDIQQLNNEVAQLKGKVHNFKSVFEELLKENEKLLKIRDGLNALFTS